MDITCNIIALQSLSKDLTPVIIVLKLPPGFIFVPMSFLGFVVASGINVLAVLSPEQLYRTSLSK